MIESDFVDCITMAEKKSDMRYVIRVSAHKRKSEKSQEELELLEKELLVLEKNFFWLHSLHEK